MHANISTIEIILQSSQKSYHKTYLEKEATNRTKLTVSRMLRKGLLRLASAMTKKGGTSCPIYSLPLTQSLPALHQNISHINKITSSTDRSSCIVLLLLQLVAENITNQKSPASQHTIKNSFDCFIGAKRSQKGSIFNIRENMQNLACETQVTTSPSKE